uniref:TIL domain-containing protein n=1 Tax=Anopheles coluzzii TaxID=1518534 RepID=A0A6E8WAR2_ANOCL
MRLATSYLAIILIIGTMLTAIVAQGTGRKTVSKNAVFVSDCVVTIIVFLSHLKGPETIVCYDPNEAYDDCGPACGDRTCTNQRKNDSACRRSCNPGCFCRGGYVRNKSNRCVPSYMCQSMG